MGALFNGILVFSRLGLYNTSVSRRALSWHVILQRSVAKCVTVARSVERICYIVRVDFSMMLPDNFYLIKISFPKNIILFLLC